MTNNNHPITPSLELLKHWEDQHFDEGENYDVMLIQAYQAGADQELEACCEWFVREWTDIETADNLRAARRPKPPSLKKLAYDALDTYIYGEPNPKDKERTYNTIRRALEQLDD